MTDRAEAVVTQATLPTATTGRHDAFLSYSRKDRDAAARLGATLEDRGKDLWVDVEDILGGADWRERIKRGIEACRSFVFLLSPAALDSTHCREELELAAKLNKQIIPVLVREVDQRRIPPAVGDREWVFLRATDDFDGGLARLIEALETDLAWRDEHTRLAGRTREWLDAERDGSFLLRGADLRAAELWLADQTGHRESPTGEQTEYVLASRQASVVRQRQLLASVAAGLIIAVGLAIFAFLQRSEAISQRRAAQSRLLIAQSQSELGRDPSLAAVLSIEAHRAKPTLEARNAMLTLLARLGRSRGPIASHDGRVYAAAFSPDAQTVATSGADGAVRLWDVATRAPVGTPMTAGSFEVLDVAYAHHGTMLASAGGDGSVRLWDARTQRQLAMLRRTGGPAARTVAFSPDDKLLVSAGDDGAVRLWDASARAARGSLPGDGEAVNDVAFERSGMTLAGAGTGGVRVWDVRDRRLRRSFASGRSPTYSVAFSRDGRILSAGGADGTVRLWDAVSGSRRGAVACRRGPVNSLAFDYRGRLACAGADDGTVQLWDVRTRHRSGPALIGHEEAVNTVAFSPDGRTLVSASSDRTARVWDVAHDGSLSGVLRGHHAAATAVEFGSEDRTLASADHDGEIVLWDLPARRERLRLRGESRAVNAIAVGPDELLASATESGTVTLERGAAGRRTLLRGGDPVYALALRPGGRQLASGGADAAVRLGDVRGGRKPALLRGHRQAVTSLRYAPDGRLLASASLDASVRLWDAGRRRPLGELGRHRVAVYGVDFSPDGALLAAALRDGTVQLWDVARRRRSGLPLRGDAAALAVAFARDGLTLAVADQDGRVQLWDLRERRRLGVALEHHADAVNALSFSRDGRLLASAASDGDIHLWDSLLWSKGSEDGEGRLERALCARVRRNLSVAEQRTFLPDGTYRETCPAG